MASTAKGRAILPYKGNYARVSARVAAHGLCVHCSKRGVWLVERGKGKRSGWALVCEDHKPIDETKHNP